MKKVVLLLLNALLISATAAGQTGVSRPANLGSTPLAANQLPTTVRQTIAKKYPGYHVDGAVKITKPGASTTYRVELEGSGKKELLVIFNGAGTVLSSRGDDQDDQDERDDD